MSVRLSVVRDAAVAVAAVAVVACSSSSSTEADSDVRLDVVRVAGVVFMTQNVVQDVTMDALFEGDVVADEAGCLRLQWPDAATVVWPHGSTAVPTEGRIEIRDAESQWIGRIGGGFTLGGGEVSALSDAMGFRRGVRGARADSTSAGRVKGGPAWGLSEALLPGGYLRDSSSMAPRVRYKRGLDGFGIGKRISDPLLMISSGAQCLSI